MPKIVIIVIVTPSTKNIKQQKPVDPASFQFISGFNEIHVPCRFQILHLTIVWLCQSPAQHQCMQKEKKQTNKQTNITFDTEIVSYQKSQMENIQG